MAREYVALALACGRVLPGLVDDYLGPARPVPAEATPPAPTALVARARWLRAEIGRSALAAGRRGFLGRQVVALECALRRRAGATLGFRDEVQQYFDTDITLGEPDRYRAAHARLAEALPGTGSLAARLAAHREQVRVPRGLVGPAAQRLSEALRGAARAEWGLPPGDTVQLELVTGRAWSALHRYLGGHRSRVLLNTDVPVGATQLARLIAHEVCPGHHTERCRAEAGLDWERPERGLFLANTPQSLLSEGQADHGLEALVGPAWGSWTESALAGLPVTVHGEVAMRVERAMAELLPVRQDAALMLHDRGASEDTARDHLRRWLLVPEARADQILGFITHPRWRAYTTAYVEGYRLVGEWLAARTADQSVTERYLRLYDEPRAPSALRAALPRTVTAAVNRA